MTNVEEDANESKVLNNRRLPRNWETGSVVAVLRSGEEDEEAPSLVRTERVEVDEIIGKKDPSISVWKRLQPLLFAAILIGFPLSNAVFFSAHM